MPFGTGGKIKYSIPEEISKFFFMTTKTTLIRGLSLIDAIAIVIGTIIGTGIFLKAGTMAQLLGSPFWVLAAWVVGGLLSLTGALAYAELGSLLPEAGGEYVYLRNAWDDLTAFLYGWMRFWIGSPGSIAAYSVGAMTFAAGMIDLEPFGGKTACAIYAIGIFSVLNCLTVSFGGKLNSFMTALKIVMLFAITLGIFFFSKGATFTNVTTPVEGYTGFAGWSAFGSALLASLWAYDGWNNLSMVAGEIKDPKKNVPLSLIIGVFCILGLYGIVNLAYFYALPMTEIITSNSNDFPDALPVGTKAAMTFLGGSGVTILSAAFVFSSLGAMNGSILTSARVPFAMARDGLFFKQLGNVSEKTHVPVVSILVQMVISMVIAASGTFDQLTDYVIFSSWIFYAMVTYGVIRLRRLRPNDQRDYKALGYPYLPLIFVIIAILLLINTIITSPKSTAIGLGLILLGVPVYFFFRKSLRKEKA